MVLIFYTKYLSNLTSRYWDMVPDGHKNVTDKKSLLSSSWKIFLIFSAYVNPIYVI